MSNIKNGRKRIPIIIDSMMLLQKVVRMGRGRCDLILWRKCRRCCTRYTRDMVFFIQVKVSVMCTPRNLVLYTTSAAVLLIRSGVWFFGLILPEVNDDLLCFVHIQKKVVSAAPVHQLLHLLSVGLVIVASNEAHYCRIISIFDDMVGDRPGDTVMCH